MKTLLTRFCAMALSAVLLLQGCTYQGKLRRGIYHPKPEKEKINAKVLVVNDRYFPAKVNLDVDGQYTYQLREGLPIAVADALGSLFTQVDVDEYKNKDKYDYIAEIEYKAQISLGAVKIEYKNVLLPEYSFDPTLFTHLTITLRNPKTGYAVGRFSEEVPTVLPTYRNDVGVWSAGMLTLLSLGLLSPIQVQVIGSKIRKRLEKGIELSLSHEIMPSLRDNRVNFSPDHATEKSNIRVDGKYLPFMKATVYIFTEDGLGSGFFISSDGYILTNRHVVGDARDVSVVLYDERAQMDKTNPTAYPENKNIINKVRFAKVLQTNKARDLALLKIEGENYPHLELEFNRKAYVTGKEVVAIGAPKGIEWSVSQGILSAVRDNNGVDTLQTDAAINGGNSGGPLISLDSGRVLGINSWKRGGAAEEHVENLNFAISAYEAQRTLDLSQPLHLPAQAH